MSNSTGIRYFHITKLHKRLPVTVCEYFGHFGSMVSKSHRFRYQIPTGKELWVISGNDYFSSYTAEITCLMLQNDHLRTVSVDLKAASNPIDERKPAMKGSRRK